MFEIKQLDPQAYRQQTRRSTLIVVVIFAVLALALSSMAVAVFGEPGDNNFIWNLAGVLTGLVVSSFIVRTLLWDKPFMAAARYGWQLKRSLMSVTNVMHHVEAAVAANDPAAIKLLRFYQLGLTQMHQLDGNTSALADLRSENEAHRQKMGELGIPEDQYRLDPHWLEKVKSYGKGSER